MQNYVSGSEPLSFGLSLSCTCPVAKEKSPLTNVAVAFSKLTLNRNANTKTFHQAQEPQSPLNLNDTGVVWWYHKIAHVHRSDIYDTITSINYDQPERNAQGRLRLASSAWPIRRRLCPYFWKLNRSRWGSHKWKSSVWWISKLQVVFSCCVPGILWDTGLVQTAKLKLNEFGARKVSISIYAILQDDLHQGSTQLEGLRFLSSLRHLARGKRLGLFEPQRVSNIW